MAVGGGVYWDDDVVAVCIIHEFLFGVFGRLGVLASDDHWGVEFVG